MDWSLVLFGAYLVFMVVFAIGIFYFLVKAMKLRRTVRDALRPFNMER